MKLKGKRRTKAQRVLVCGDREWFARAAIERHLRRFSKSTTVIHGACRGADSIGGEVAKALGFEVVPYPANWAAYGKAAGPLRNQLMLDEGKPTLVLAFHQDLASSKGTKDMVSRAERAGVPVRVINNCGNVTWRFPMSKESKSEQMKQERDRFAYANQDLHRIVGQLKAKLSAVEKQLATIHDTLMPPERSKVDMPTEIRRLRGTKQRIIDAIKHELNGSVTLAVYVLNGRVFVDVDQLLTLIAKVE